MKFAQMHLEYCQKAKPLRIDSEGATSEAGHTINKFSESS